MLVTYQNFGSSKCQAYQVVTAYSKHLHHAPSSWTNDKENCHTMALLSQLNDTMTKIENYFPMVSMVALLLKYIQLEHL